MTEWEVVSISDHVSYKQALAKICVDADQISIFRTVFNAPFYKHVGFVTKRAADTILSKLENVYMSSVKNIMKVVTEEKQKMCAHLLTECKQDIDDANVKDKILSEELKLKREIVSTKDLHSRLALLKLRASSKKNHFDMIIEICESDPTNEISKKVISYIKNIPEEKWSANNNLRPPSTNPTAKSNESAVRLK